MVKKSLIWIGVVVILIPLYNFGLPNEINVWGAKWCLRDCDKQNPPSVVTNNNGNNQEKTILTPLDFLSILNLVPRQKIYSPDDEAIVDFFIQDEKNIPYNITVNWFYNETRYLGWYNESNKTQPFYAWLTTNKKGIWDVQVLLKWNYNNVTYSKDETTQVTVK